MIRVTKEQIAKSLALIAKGKSTPCNCPLAVSIQEETGCGYVSVGLTSAIIAKDGLECRPKLPQIARDLIRVLERGISDPEPIEFELEVNFA